MKYAKLLGLLTLTVTPLTVFACSASATELTSPENTKYAVGNVIHAKNYGSIKLDGTVNVTCENSIINGTVNANGGIVTAQTNVLTFVECGGHTVTVVSNGTLAIYSIGANKGELRSSGAEITVLTHGLFFGTRHCVYVTNNTHIGTLLGSLYGGYTTATLIADSAPLAQTTDSLCGSEAEWTGTYEFTSPTHLYID